MRAIKSVALRRLIKTAVPFVAIPATVLLGSLVIDQKRHLFVSIAVAVLSLILFYAGFEKKEIGTRRMVVVAVLIALSVAGRFIPIFKPVTAITIIAAIYLGGEAGFLVGSLSALLSNFYFGQGPWTPFQMLAWGMIGLFAGLMSSPLRKSRVFLIVYGVISGALFSAVMDIWTVLSYSNSPDPKLYVAALVTAIPHMIIYALSNLIFLLLLDKPIGQKLERIRIKYGI